ncbi:MAG: hypothetical protein SPG06_04650 [Eubacteriales bacterium]|nr:hypothetical protein [Eubacteriales bacterium]
MKNFIITKEQIETLRPFMPNIDELIQGDIQDFQLALDDAMLDTLKDEEATDLTIKLERIYDEIYDAN